MSATPVVSAVLDRVARPDIPRVIGDPPGARRASSHRLVLRHHGAPRQDAALHIPGLGQPLEARRLGLGPADMDAIIAICARHEVPLIEDAAESLGATHRSALQDTDIRVEPVMR